MDTIEKAVIHVVPGRGTVAVFPDGTVKFFRGTAANRVVKCSVSMGGSGPNVIWPGQNAPASQTDSNNSAVACLEGTSTLQQ
jgi:hypothetical protein